VPLCSGTAPACSAATDITACQARSGCTWSTQIPCTGSPTPCAELPASTCAAQPGCALEPL
jgi:hypothetical protein